MCKVSIFISVLRLLCIYVIVVIEEIVEDGKPSNGNGTHRRLRKKHQVSDTEDGDDDSQRQRVVKPAAPAAVESEDEDGFPLSFSASKMNTGRNVGTVKELSEKTDDEDRKRKIDAISQDSESERYSLCYIIVFYIYILEI